MIFRNADWIILLGGVTLTSVQQKRTDLIRENGPIFVEQGRAINDVAPNSRRLGRHEPLQYPLPDRPSRGPRHGGRALVRHDQTRLDAPTALLADKAGVTVSQISRLSIWGNHSESVYPDFNNAAICDRPAPSVITDRNWVRTVFEPTVANRSTEILKLRQASPAATGAGDPRDDPLDRHSHPR